MSQDIHHRQRELEQLIEHAGGAAAASARTGVPESEVRRVLKHRAFHSVLLHKLRSLYPGHAATQSGQWMSKREGLLDAVSTLLDNRIVILLDPRGLSLHPQKPLSATEMARLATNEAAVVERVLFEIPEFVSKLEDYDRVGYDLRVLGKSNDGEQVSVAPVDRRKTRKLSEGNFYVSVSDE